MKTNLKTNDRPAISSPKRTVVNVRLLIITAITCAIAAPTLYAWQRYQQQKNATAFLEQATAQEKDQHWRKAADFLGRYLQLRPEDNDARIRLAFAYNSSAGSYREKTRATELLYQAIGIEQSAVDEGESPDRLLRLRRDLATTLFALGSDDPRRFASAQSVAEDVLKGSAADPVGLRVKGLAQYARLIITGTPDVSIEDAVATLCEAVVANPNDVPLSYELARIYRDELTSMDAEQRQETADEVMDAVVNNNPQTGEALLARYDYRTRYGLDGADADLDQALVIDPQNVDALVLAGQRAGKQGNTKAVAEYFNRAIEQSPDEARVYVFFGTAYSTNDMLDEAVTVWRRGWDELDDRLELGQRLASGLLDQGHPQEALDILGRLEGEITGFERRLSRSGRLTIQRRIDLLRGRALVEQRKYVEAIPHLRKPLLTGDSSSEDAAEVSLREQALYFLAQCYNELEQHDQAATIYLQAAGIRAGASRHLIAAAGAWEAAGRYDDAVELYDQAIGMDDAPPITYVLRARAEFKRQVNQLESDQDWSRFDSALAEAKQKTDATLSLALLDAQYALHQGNAKKALELLEPLKEAFPDSDQVRRALIFAYEQLGRSEDGLVLIDEREEEAGRTTATLLLRADLLTHSERFEEALELLTGGMDDVAEADQGRVAQYIAYLSLRTGKIQEAWAALRNVAVEQPTNLDVLGQLNDFALDVHDFGNAFECERRFVELEGEAGTLWRYYRARRLMLQADDAKDERFLQAMRLQQELSTMRPSWPRSHLLKAQLADRRKNYAEAIEAYKTAIELGEKYVYVYEALISALYQQGSFEEAERYLSRVSKDETSGKRLSGLDFSIALQRKDHERAIRLVREEVEQNPSDATLQSRMALALMLAGKKEEAEVWYGRSVEMEPDNISMWVGLLAFYIRTDRPENARETLQRIERNAEVDREKRVAVLANGYERLGDLDQAKRLYLAAVEADPENEQLHYRASAFFLNQLRETSVESMRDLYKSAPRSGPLRRGLARALAISGTPDELDEAIGLVPVDLDAEELVPEDVRVRALALMRRSKDDDRENALKLLEALTRNVEDTIGEDYLLLADLYEVAGQPQRAREQLLRVVNRDDAKITHIAAYINLLLKMENPDDALPWLEKLESRPGAGFRTVRLRARWLKAKGKEGEIEALVEGFMRQELQNTIGDLSQLTQILETARLYDEVGLPEQAEHWFREAVAQNPRSYVELAHWLATQHRVSDAVDVCVEAASHDESSMSATLLARLLVEKEATKENFATAEPVINDALSRYSDDVVLLYEVATMRHLTGAAKDAIPLYERVLEIAPKHIAALNNLAMLLSEEPEQLQRATELIELAIKEYEPRGTHLQLEDTRALIMLRRGEVDVALDTLQRVTQNEDADSQQFFHLAVAYERAGDMDKAREALANARTLNLAINQLSPRERLLLAQLDQNLKP